MPEHTPDNGWSLPFEPQKLQYMDIDTMMAGAVVVMAAVVQGPDQKHPAIIFRFINAVGEFLPPITLVMDPTHLGEIPGLVTAAVAQAIKEST